MRSNARGLIIVCAISKKTDCESLEIHERLEIIAARAEVRVPHATTDASVVSNRYLDSRAIDVSSRGQRRPPIMAK